MQVRGGSSWTKIDALTTRNLTSVVAIANDNVWLVGDGGTVRLWNLSLIHI